jgi:hypothetical protein
VVPRYEDELFVARVGVVELLRVVRENEAVLVARTEELAVGSREGGQARA